MTLEETLAFNKNPIERLRAQLATNEKVVPFVGAGIGAPYKFKLWKQFLEDLAREYGVLGPVQNLLEVWKYEDAAELIITTIGDHAFHQAIEDEFGPDKLEIFVPNAVLNSIPRLTQGPVVTTNYDHILEKTFALQGLGFDRTVFGVGKTATQQVAEQSRRFLLKIHGDATEKSNRILTKTEYQLHYGDLDGKGYDPNLDLPKMLERIMSGKPLLFLGCSLEADRTLAVLEQITNRMDHGGHYAILNRPMDQDAFNAKKIRLSKCRITPIWYEAPKTADGYDHSMLESLLLHLTADLTDPSPKPKLPKGQLTGREDSRLQPSEPFFGREEDKIALHNWLRTNAGLGNVYSTANIKGAPGIGKSRLCQKVIAEYLFADAEHKAFYISLQSASGLDGLWARIAEAYEWEDTEVQDFPNRMDAIGGLIYLDNLEDVLDDPKVRPILKRFAQFQNAKVLSSSRQALGLEAKNILLGRLDDAAAIALFQEHWHRCGGAALLVTDKLTGFIHNRLDNHALSIKLVASQAEGYPAVERLMEDWEKAAMALAQTIAVDPDKDESLEVSISLSYHKVCGRSPEAIQAWATIALFPEGMSEMAQSSIFPGTWVGAASPPNILLHYSIVERRDGHKLYMLAPIQQFIFAQVPLQDDGNAVSQSLDKVFQFLFSLASTANGKLRSHDLDRRQWIDAMLDQFPAMGGYIERSQNLGAEWPEKTAAIYQELYNLFQFRSLLGHPILNKMVATFRAAHMIGTLANALQSLGDLESRLGNVDSARALYEEAIGHYKTERANLGLANALQSLGDLESRLGNVDSARALYEEAIGHYKTERANLGLANALQSLGDLDRRLGNVDSARALYEEAIGHYKTERDHLGLANALKSLGDLDRRLGNVDSARALYEEAIGHYKTERDHLGLANALKSLGDLESRLGNVDSARALYEEAIGHYKTERDHLGLANALKSLGDLESRLGNVDSARALYEEAIGHYKTERANLGLANALKSLGDLESRLGNVDSARALYEEAIGHYKTERANLGLANALQSLGDLDRRLGNVDSARALYEEAIGHYKTERDHLGLANALKSLGDLDRRLGNVDSARALYEEAIGHYKTERANLGLANALKSLGDLDRRLGNVDSARALYEEAIGHYKTERDHLGLANALKSLGDLESRLGNVDSARALYEEAIGHYKTERANLGLANALKSLGDLESRLGNVDSARALYEEAIGHYKTERDDQGLANVKMSWGLMLLMADDLQSAFHLLAEAAQLFEKEQDPMGLAQSLALIAFILHGAGQADARDQTYAQALAAAHASHTPGVIAYVENFGKEWGAKP